jgi:hypothetical protein
MDRAAANRCICERPIRQKRVVVQYLTTLASALDRRGCHTPYICPNAGDSSLVRLDLGILAVPSLSNVPLFHQEVFALCRNNLATPWLAPHQQSNLTAYPAMNGLRRYVLRATFA